MIPNTKTIKSQLEEISKKIGDLQTIVDHIKNALDRAANIFSKYHEIALDILGKYELNNSKLKNYQVLKTLKYLGHSNKKLIEDLDEILYIKDIKENKDNTLILQFAKLIGIYEGNRRVFKRNIIFQTSDSSEDIKCTDNNEEKINMINLSMNNGQDNSEKNSLTTKKKDKSKNKGRKNNKDKNG